MSIHIDNFQATLMARASARLTPSAPVPVNVTDEDDHFEFDPDTGYAEGQSFVIEYEDSRGTRSTRRITVWGISRGVGDVPLLVATCHERKAQRSFRVDRIKSCITYDGVIHDVPEFLVECFGMSLSTASATSDSADADMWGRVRNAVRREAVLLAALSHSDGLMHPAEAEVAIRHCEYLAERRQLYITEAVLRSLVRYFGRLRPTERDISDALEILMSSDPSELVRFLTACVRLIDADGRRHPEELSLVNSLATELVGLPVV